MGEQRSTLLELIDKIERLIGKNEGINELKKVAEYASIYGLKKIRINAALARGLSYYTGTIFEIYAKDKAVSSSVAAGGRYDKMIGIFSGRDIPAVGIGFGVDAIFDAMKAKIKEIKKSLARVYVIPIKMKEEAIRLAKALRDSGINADIDLMERGITKNLEYANSYQIPYVIFVGEEEVKKGKYKLKDMKSGEERLLAVNEIAGFFK